MCLEKDVRKSLRSLLLSSLRSVAASLLLLVVILASCDVQFALATTIVAPPPATTEWVRTPGDPGSWYNPTNWSDSTPDEMDVAEISNGGVVQIRRGRAEARILRMESPQTYNVSSNHLVQHRGRLRIFEAMQIQEGEYDLLGGAFRTPSFTLGRVLLPLLSLPRFPTTPIIFDDSNEPPPDFGLQPEQLEVEVIEPLVFRFPTQQFHQSGGRSIIDGRLSIYGGGVRVSRGRMSADSILIDIVNSSLLTRDGSEPARGFEQAGGYVKIEDSLLIQNGAYELSSGVLSVERIAIGDPAMEGSIVTRFNRAPEFVQTGGFVRVRGNLELCVPGFNPTLLPFLKADYLLEGGSIYVSGDTVVGSLGVAPVNFIQSAGRARIGGTLRIEGDSSTYDISGGKLYTNNLEIGLGEFNTGGTFAYTAPASVRVKERIALGADSRFEAVPGSKLRFLGDRFENFSTDDTNHRGFNDLELTVAGDWRSFLRRSPPQITEFEVGGENFGDSDDGYLENFALDTLRVGSFSPAYLRLVDLVDNQPDYDGTEALYVDRLIVRAGSTLDLGGIPLFYRTANILGSIVDGAAMPIFSVVPEPSSLSLLLVGLVTFLRRRQTSCLHR